jgi:hypothetical protein
LIAVFVTLWSGCKENEPTPPSSDTTPPSVVVTQPANGATLTGSTMIKAEATDNSGVQWLDFLVDGSLLGRDSTAPYEKFWDVTSISDSSTHTILAKAVDNAGNVGQSPLVTVTVVKDRTPPSVVITQPANGVTLTSATIIRVDAVDNRGVWYVTFLIDGQTVGSDSSAPYELFWNAGFWADGNLHTILAKAADSAGNIGQSQLITVTVSTNAQIRPELVYPSDSASITDTNRTVRLVWRAIPSALQYEIVVARSSDFTSPVFTTMINDTFAVTPRLNPNLYFWRTRASNIVARRSEWSESRRFALWNTFMKNLGPYLSLEAVEQTTDKGYIAVGTNSSFYYTLTRADSNGQIQWQTTLFRPSSYSFGPAIRNLGVVQTTDGGYAVVGHAYSLSTRYDVYLAKTNPNGNILWERALGGAGDQWGRSLQQTADGGFIVAGDTGWYQSVYLVKTDGSGNMAWERTFAGRISNHIVRTIDGGFLITGQIKGSYFLYVLKLNANGDSLWQRNFNAGTGMSIQQTSDGGFIVAGWNYVFPNYRVYLIRTDISGNLSWERTFVGHNSNSYGLSVQQTADGGYIIAGYNALYKTDASGNLQWSRDLDITVRWARQTSDGGFIVVGIGPSPYNFGWLVKTDQSGNVHTP